jgi:uncharacterized membrane protein YdcZ (DUF606 family)
LHRFLTGITLNLVIVVVNAAAFPASPTQSTGLKDYPIYGFVGGYVGALSIEHSINPLINVVHSPHCMRNKLTHEQR